MKRFFLLSALIAFTISFSNAQTETTQAEDAPFNNKRNVIKFFPTSLAFGKATIGYERVINKNGSFTFNLGLPSGINPLDYAPDFSSEEFSMKSGTISGKLFMPGYRFNFSKKGAPVGFFIEPYMKYESFTLDFEAEFTDTNDNTVYPAKFDGDYSGFGGGIQMGVQCMIAKTITLEWSFFGLEAKSANAELTVTDVNGTIDIDELFDEIEVNFSDIPLIGNKLEFVKGSDYVGAKTNKLILPGFRFAFSVGIAF